jgi:hypothetical protein
LILISYQVDQCNGFQTVFNGFTSQIIGAGDFEAAGSLATASLNTVFQVYDYVSSSYHTLAVDLAWTEDGYVQRGHNHVIVQALAYRYSARSNGSYRSARISGTSLLGSVNFTPGEGYGSISSVRNGSVNID